MELALNKIIECFESPIISEKGHCTRIIAKKNNVTWYFDIYQDVVLVFDGINEQVELKTIEELENYLTTC